MTERELFDRRMTRLLRRMSVRQELLKGHDAPKGWRRWLGASRGPAINQAIVDVAYQSTAKGDGAALSVFWFMHQVAKDPSLLERVIGPTAGAIAITRVGFQASPSRTAEFILRLFLPAHQRQHAIGDLLEEYHVHMVPRFGVPRANLWFWYQTLASIAPVLYGRLRPLLKLALLLKAADWIRRIGG